MSITAHDKICLYRLILQARVRIETARPICCLDVWSSGASVCIFPALGPAVTR